MTTPNPIEITCSRDFLEWLYTERISLSFTTYQTNRLFLLGVKPNGDLSTFERLFDRPMGLYAAADQLYFGGRYQIWRLDNALPPGQTHDGYDALYVPRRSFTTGDVDVHDVQVDKNGRLLFINTLYSCLATVSERYSFQPVWQPPFISKLAPEDRCHLNGLALENGEARYVTAVSRSDVFAGWRKRRESGGLLIDIQNNAILLNNLSMPHSPRVHNDKLWLLNAGSGDLGYVNREKGTFEPVAFCPGFGRGLTFHKNYAIVGLSKPRRVKAFEGLSLDDKLAAKDADAICGLAVIDISTGNIAHWVEVEGLISELYDVAILPDVRRPMALGFKNDEISRFITIDHPDTPPIFQQLKAPPTNSGQATAPIDFTGIQPSIPNTSASPSTTFRQAQEPLKNHSVPNLQSPIPNPQFLISSAPSPYRFQLSANMTLAAVIQNYDQLTFPNLAQHSRGRTIREPLAAVIANLNGEAVGMALAEAQPDNQGANLLSCFVAAPHRRRGIATRLLAHLEKALAGYGMRHLDLTYRSDWPSLPIVEQFLARHNWLPPKTNLHQYKVNMADLAFAPWLYDELAKLPAGFECFPWSDLPAAERTTIQQKQADGGWYPANLDPFQADEYLAFNGMGLRYQGQVVGWMVTHRSASDAIQYTSLFLAPQHQRQRLGVPLLAATLQRQLESDIPYAIWQVEANNEAMLVFVRRFLQAYLAKESQQLLARKNLLVNKQPEGGGVY